MVSFTLNNGLVFNKYAQEQSIYLRRKQVTIPMLRGPERTYILFRNLKIIHGYNNLNEHFLYYLN